MPTISTLIIIFTTLISIYAFSNAKVFQFSLMNPFMVFKRNQYWRLVTSGFIHGSYIHLGFNMFTFYFFGRFVEQIFERRLGENGAWIFILFYLSAIVISDLPVAFKKRNQLSYNSLGASGAVSAMVFASILYYPLNDICLYGLLCLPGFILGAIYILYSYFQGKNLSDNINHEAHLYGAIYGILFAIVVYPASAPAFIDQISTFSIF